MLIIIYVVCCYVRKFGCTQRISSSIVGCSIRYLQKLLYRALGGLKGLITGHTIIVRELGEWQSLH